VGSRQHSRRRQTSFLFHIHVSIGVLGTLFQSILEKEKRPELFPLSYLRKVSSLTSAFTEGREIVFQTIHKYRSTKIFLDRNISFSLCRVSALCHPTCLFRDIHMPLQFSTTSHMNLTTSSKNNFKASKVKTCIQLSIFQSLNPFKMSQLTEATTPQTCAYFSDPRFPAEIKDLIWTFAIDDIPPRTVDIISNPKSPPNLYSWISTAPIPALLHTCARSRSLTQKSYPLSFTSQTTSNNGTYFNFQKDTLYFGREFKFATDFIEDVGEERGRR
jgi:hypothetical protein